MVQQGQMLHHPHNCLNVKKPFARACKICIEACPHKAISEYREVDLSRCTECGVCMAVCPSDGFVDRAMDDLHGYLQNSEEIVLNCPQAAPLGWEIPCLGLIDRDFWLTLMLYALAKPVRLLTGLCSGCPDKEACAISVETFKSIHTAWPDHPQVQVTVKPSNGESGEILAHLLGRDEKGGLRNWRELGLKKVERWLPGLVAEETYDIPKTRQWLMEVLALHEQVQIPFLAIVVEDSCTNCGVCAAICPQGALTKRQKGENLQLVLEPLRCVQCRRCIEICQPKALSLSSKPLSHRLLKGKILLHEGTPRYCSHCGKQIFDNSEPPVCLACATRDPDRRSFFL
ncbi:MAG: NADH-quinone oxidoreductase subunit I [Desulfitobacteriaceae bacterium]